ncbi:thiamine-phosphate kinase [Rubricoccus marinus]|uniref:Thiamine-monophosphate kinase n=1 Tax=Rubricoccus marinus TaxID=716817 RepID=A0A259U302_9BACT|nr:thiamine-phosphate kinase [Rubricoccus marinus]OZC04342.1 thiamine-phosphate kinase [Rubricoccus marinus]
MSDSPVFTPVSEVGEFGLIARLQEVLGDAARSESLTTPIGDDAAVSDLGGGRSQVITTDLFVEGVHFDRTFAPLRALGWKCVAASVSDVCAMNATPTLVTVALGLPNNLSVEGAEALYTGIAQACERYGCTVAGGDISASARLVVSVTVLGEAETERIVTRAGAAPGEVLCVTGDLGASAAGLELLLRGKEQTLASGAPPEAAETSGDGSPTISLTPDAAPIDLGQFPTPLERHLMPQARLDRVRLWREVGFQPTSLIDVSDGVASEAHHLSIQSTVGVVVEAGLLPVHIQTMQAAEALAKRAETWALYGGEDYELMFTAPQEALEVLPKDSYAVVGNIVEPEEGVALRMPDGTVIPMEADGFKHF